MCRAYLCSYFIVLHQFTTLFSPHSAKSFGGYDYELVGRVPRTYICIICKKTLRDAQLTLCCGQHFCDSCVKQWLSTKAQKIRKTCPYCRQTDFQSVLNKEKVREVNELRVYCIHKEKGCKWVGELRAIKEHLERDEGCGYVKVECTNQSCNEKIERYRLTKHLKCMCMHRQYTCEYCGYKDTYDAIAGSGYKYPLDSTACKSQSKSDNHYAKCANYPLHCPNKCGEAKIKRKDMKAHRDSCELEPLNCPFKYVGCTDKIQRKHMESHCQDSIQSHLLLLAKSHEQLARKNEELCNEIEELKISKK